MSLYNTQDTYGSVAKFFHWLIALLVIIMLAAGISFNYIPRASHFMGILMFLHKSTGVTILLLMIVRLCWRWVNPYPAFPITMPTLQKIAARIVHFLFYILLIAMPITGIVMSLSAGYPVPFWGLGHVHFAFIIKNEALKILMVQWHKYLAWTIGILIVLHTLAALKHHFIDKDNILKKIM